MSGRLKISPGGPGVSMKNMLASIPFDPYNTPKTFPKGGKGGGTPGPPGPPGPSGPPAPVAVAGSWFPIHFWRPPLFEDYQVIVSQNNGWDHVFEFTIDAAMKIRVMMDAEFIYIHAAGNNDPCRGSLYTYYRIWDEQQQGWDAQIDLGTGAAYFNSDPYILSSAGTGPHEMWNPYATENAYDVYQVPPATQTPDDLHAIPGTYQVTFHLGVNELTYHGGENWGVRVVCAIDGALLGA